VEVVDSGSDFRLFVVEPEPEFEIEVGFELVVEVGIEDEKVLVGRTWEVELVVKGLWIEELKVLVEEVEDGHCFERSPRAQE